MDKERGGREDGTTEAGRTRSKRKQDNDEQAPDTSASKRSRTGGAANKAAAPAHDPETSSDSDRSSEDEDAPNTGSGSKRRPVNEDNTLEGLKRRLVTAQSHTATMKAEAERLKLRLDEERRQRATDQMYYTRQLQMQDQRYRELWGQYERAYALAKQPGVPKFSFDMIARADRDVQNYTGFRNAEGLRQFRELCLQRGVKEEYESMPAVKIDAKPGKDADEHPAEDEEEAAPTLPAIAPAPVNTADQAGSADAPGPEAPAQAPGQGAATTGDEGASAAAAQNPKKKDGRKFGRPSTVNFDDALMILLVRNKHNTPYFLLGHLFGTSPNTVHRVFLRIKASVDKRYPDAKLPQKKSTNLSITQA